MAQNVGQQNEGNQNDQNAALGLVDQLMSQVTDMVQRQFGLKPNNSTIAYRKPYPAWYDQVMLPPCYRLPDFTKFIGNGSTMEHIS